MRRWIPPRIVLAALALTLSGCLTDFPGYHGDTDFGAPDGGGRLDATAPDVRSADGASPDAGPGDAASVDGPFSDSALPDAVAPEAGAPDAGTPDAGALDAGALDAGPRDRDAETADATTSDAEVDGAVPDAGPGDAGPGDAAVPDAACEPGEEVCDGVDNDCDGRVDEGTVCGPYVARRCRVWLGWADKHLGPEAASPTWGDCPGRDADGSGDVRCTSTRGDERFRTLHPEGNVNADDRLGVAFTCADPARPELAAWIQSRCAVFLGHADLDRGADGIAQWGPCPEFIAGDDGDRRCVSSGFDGQFRPLFLVGSVDHNDDLAVAFICRDEGDPARALALQGAAEVFLAWSRWDWRGADGSETWGDCPGSRHDNAGDDRCVSSHGDGLFHKIDLAGEVDGFDVFGIMLRAR